MKTRLALAAALLLCALPLSAQTPAQAPAQPSALDQVLGLGLDSLAAPLPVYHRAEQRARAAEVQAILRQGARFFADSLGLETPVRVALLGRADWDRVSQVPYGVPYVRGGVVFLPATPDGAIAADFLRLEPGASERVRALVAATGVSFADNARRMTDLIGYHELGHGYTSRYGIRPHARWFSEFLATYFAYAFLERTNPRLARSWEAMLRAKLDAPAPAHTSLDDFERLYLGVGPENYNWYQAAFALEAAEVFRAEGLGFLARVRERFPAGAGGEALPAAAVLERLEAIRPGFRAWGEQLAPR